MTIKTIEDWRKVWVNASGTDAKKAQCLLQQYVNDSKTGIAGFTYPIDWYVTSGGKNVRYLSSQPVENTLGRVTFDDDIDLLLRYLKQNMIYFYTIKLHGIDNILKGDELLHVLQVIQEKTGRNFSAIDLTQDQEMACSFSRV